MRKVIEGAGREIILKVLKFCEAEMKNKGLLIPLNNVRARVAAMTGVSEKTVARINKEGKIAEITSTKIVTPGKIRPHPKKYSIDNIGVGVIGQKIYQFYIKENKLPTVNNLRLELKKDNNFQGSNTTLRRILKGMGLRFKHDFNILGWMNEKILPNLPESSILMYIPPNRNTEIIKTPTMTSLKSEMQEWLKQKGLFYEESWTKSVLYEKIKNNQFSITDGLLVEHHHEVMELPPYHRDLNPVENISSQIKRKIAVKRVAEDAKKDGYLENKEPLSEEMDRIYISTECNSDADTVDTTVNEDSDSDCSMSDIKTFGDHCYCK